MALMMYEKLCYHEFVAITCNPSAFLKDKLELLQADACDLR